MRLQLFSCKFYGCVIWLIIFFKEKVCFVCTNVCAACTCNAWEGRDVESPEIVVTDGYDSSCGFWE